MVNTPLPRVHLNGRLMALQDACVSVLDRGFMLGDGVYEVIPVYGGVPFRLHEHLARMQRSLEAIRLPNPLSTEHWRSRIQEVVDSNDGGNQSVYVQVTRGVAPMRDHGFPAETPPTVLIMSSRLKPLDPALAREGVAAITLADNRWQHCDVKAITLLPNLLLRQQALDRGAVEAILLRDGSVTEGAASNVFIVDERGLCTPPRGPRILPGITRELVLELARAHEIPVREATVSEQVLRAAEEIWLTSSTREILPVVRLDDTPVGDACPGPRWRRMHDLYQHFKQGLQNPT